jgi:hypothetical protein
MQPTGERIIPPEPGEFSLIFERHKFSYAVVTVGGIVFARSNFFRTVMQKTGLLYRIGSRLKRSHPLKEAGSQLAGLRRVTLTFGPTEAAMDLIAVCEKQVR